MHFCFQKRLLYCLVLLFPTLLFAGNSAMLTVSGGEATLNGNDSPRSSALFVGDTVTTRPDSVANINAEGSMVLVLAGSSVQFDGDSLNMGHGGVVVTTSKRMAVRAGSLTIAPLRQLPAKFEVSEKNGLVQIAAREGSLSINNGDSTMVLQEGQQTTQPNSDQGNTGSKDKGAAPGGSGFHMSRKTAAIIFGGAAAAGTTAAILLTTGGSSRPTSPAAP
ncbi:MAG TPA: hypothetical protein VKT29_12640 [Terriglobales bacterium]|nr:hypothetical protein [Terriglobales bacterium]